MKIGEFIKYYRMKNGLSCRELSRLSGVCHTSVNDIEKGICNPTLLTIIKLCNGLDLDVFDFLRATDYLKELDIDLIKGDIICAFDNTLTIEFPVATIDAICSKNVMYIEGKDCGYIIQKVKGGCLYEDKRSR